MFVSQPPVKTATIFFDGSQDRGREVESSEGLRFRDIVKVFSRYREEGEYLSTAEIALGGFFQSTTEEIGKFEEHGFVQCDGEGNIAR